ncbi:MAG: lipid-A-disaccharide synthase [Vicinamibacterales bacterium]
MTDPVAGVRPRRVMISCGEPSGDLYAGALVRALQEQAPGTTVFGFGGAQLADAGATLIGDYHGFSVTGLTEALSVLRKSWKMLDTLGEAARNQPPDVFVAIDFPDFNFRLLPIMHRLGIPIVYYISPQLWAWRAGRLRTLKKYVAKMLVIFPFEKPLYDRAGVPAEFVGHPLIDLAVAGRSREQTCRDAGLDAARPVVALLPGSRPNELRLLLPRLVGAASKLVREVPGVQFLVARAPALDDALFAPLEHLRLSGVPLGVLSNAADDVLASSDIVITASGTATVQTALHQRPMVIVYRVSPMTYTLLKPFLQVTSYGMVNLVAGRPVVAELIQDGCTEETIAGEARSLLTDRDRGNQMRSDLADVVRKLGGPGASGRAAAAVLATAAH